MIIRTTTDPISQHEVAQPESHPCMFMGDGDNGIEVYFENEANCQTFIAFANEASHPLVIGGNDTDDYVAED